MKVDKPRNFLRDVFSFSKLTCFSQCPRRFFWRYVMREKSPPSEALLLGRGTHAGQEYDNEERIKGRRPTQGEVLDRAVEAYREEGGQELDAFALEHEQQLEKFWESGERDRIQPKPGSVEAPFEIELQVTGDPDREAKTPAVVQGFVDVLSEEEGDVVVDYKTVGRPVSDRDANDSVQNTLYMVGSEAEGARNVSFVKYGKQKPTTKVTRTVGLGEAKVSKLLDFCAETIGSIRKDLVSGNFPKCAPSCWWCSAKACEFYEKCYPEKNPNLSRFVEIGEIRPVGTLEQPEWRKK